MRLTAAVDEKIVRREGNLWSLGKAAQPERSRCLRIPTSRRGGSSTLSSARPKAADELGDESRALSLVDFREMRGENVRDVLREPVRLVGVVELGQLGIETDQLARQSSGEHRVVETRLPGVVLATPGGYDGSNAACSVA